MCYAEQDWHYRSFSSSSPQSLLSLSAGLCTRGGSGDENALPVPLRTGSIVRLFLRKFAVENATVKDGRILAKFVFLGVYVPKQSRGAQTSTQKQKQNVRSIWLNIGQDGVEVHKLAKKERSQYPAILTEKNWSLKDLLYGLRGIFLAGRGGQSRAGKIALSCRSVTQSQRRISFIFPAQGASHIIIILLLGVLK